MITQNAEQLETWVKALTLITMLLEGYRGFKTYINRGWREAKKTEKRALDETLHNLQHDQSIIFRRIDELRKDISDRVTKEMHDRMQSDMTARIDLMTTALSREMSDSFTKLSNRIDLMTASLSREMADDFAKLSIRLDRIVERKNNG